MLEELTATPGDQGFITQCILYGARKGHYSFDPDNSRQVRCMRAEIQSIITKYRLFDGRNARASVFSAMGKRIAMMITCEAEPASATLEIYALSVVREHHKKGYARQIISLLLARNFHSCIIARCLPVSMPMITLLESTGFRRGMFDQDYEILVKDAIDPFNIVSASGMQPYPNLATEQLQPVSVSPGFHYID